jgi:sucrose-6-phosphate hydrolase SacC (GH32 family)
MNPITAGDFHLIYDPSTPTEKWYINDHCLIFDGQLWHMFGITHAEPADPQDEKHFAHATSPSLTAPTWTKQPFALSADPALGEALLWAPHVIRHDGLYYMFYCAGPRSGIETDPYYRIFLATSKDLWTWTRHPENPMLTDGYHGRDPMILRDGDRWIMYYTATSSPTGGNHQVKCATSTDLIHWTNQQVALNHPATGTYGGPCESPFVVRRGRKYYLFAGPNPKPSYKGTEIYVSEDPLRFDYENRMGRIDAHASEVVRDRDGKWYITHCGWGQGGLHIAPLNWTDPENDATTSMSVP